MEEQKLSFPNRHRLNNNIWAKTLLWNFRSQLRRASLVAVPQVRAKLGTAPLKQVRRAVSLHLHPPLPRLAKLSPGCFPITGGRGERGVEGSPEVPAFWGESEWLVPLPWLGVLVELAWFGTREPAETGVALRSGPGAPGGFILGREEKSGCLVSQLSEVAAQETGLCFTWLGVLLGKLIYFGCLGADEKKGQWCDLLLQHQRACSTADRHQREIMSSWKRIGNPLVGKSHTQAQRSGIPPKGFRGPPESINELIDEDVSLYDTRRGGCFFSNA